MRGRCQFRVNPLRRTHRMKRTLADGRADKYRVHRTPSTPTHLTNNVVLYGSEGWGSNPFERATPPRLPASGPGHTGPNRIAIPSSWMAGEEFGMRRQLKQRGRNS